MNTQKIRKILKKSNIDCWLIFQNQGLHFSGINPIANDICDIHELITRPWYVLIHSNKVNPVWIYQQMEKQYFKNKVGVKRVYTNRQSQIKLLKENLPNSGTIALEIDKLCNIPSLSRVDYGTVKLIQSLTKAKVVSSGEIIGEYLSTWTHKQLSQHKTAVSRLLNILTDTKKLIAKNKGKITDYEVRLHIEKLYKKHNLVTVYHPVVASGKNTANPHYFTSKDNQNLIKENEILLIDIWGKINEQGSVFSDITTMFYTGKNIPQEIEKAWKVLINARDKALNTLKQNLNSKQIKANRIDMVARKVIEENGYGNYFIHRLGHNISTDLHGYGPNFDNYETIDGRKVLPSSGYSLEPGIYTKNFGLRSEINIYINRKGQVYETTPIPKFIEKI